MYMCARHISTQIVMWAISCWCAWHFVNMPTFCWCEVHVHVACWVFFFLLWYIGCASHIHVINLYHNDKNHDWINKKKKKEIWNSVSWVFKVLSSTFWDFIYFYVAVLTLWVWDTLTQPFALSLFLPLSLISLIIESFSPVWRD